MKHIIKETTHIKRKYEGLDFELDFGWGNGYVLLEKDHKYYNVDYDKIPVYVHGGLTYGNIITEDNLNRWSELEKDDIGKYMIGFDTMHYNDTLQFWSKERVEEETIFLKNQL